MRQPAAEHEVGAGGGPALLIAAQSARALATAAVRGGYRPIAVDFFADDDTRAISLHAARYPGSFRCGFAARRLLPALEAAVAAAGVEPVGLVLGSGFEDRPRLIARLAALWRLLGCGAEAVAAVKHPERFAAACRALDIPHPTITRVVPGEGRWLLRRRGGSGGTHIRPATPGPVPTHHFAMEQVEGRPISALVLADGRRAEIVAWSRQGVDPTPEEPWRFASVAGPVSVPGPIAAAVAAAAARVTERFGLRGLVSLDLLVDGESWHLLEVNPRPGGSLDALDRTDPPLLAAHVAACEGRLVGPSYPNATIRATRVVYATEDSFAGPTDVWPDWCLDRPAAGTRIAAGEPVVTVTAEAEDVDRAEQRAAERAIMASSLLGKVAR